jgi:protein farnesyltransferase subunit beta
MSSNSSQAHQQSYARARYVVESESTEQQSETEDEVEPFFANLEHLTNSQLDHLRQVGLLPPLVSFSCSSNDADDDDKINSNSNNNSLKIQMLRQKHIQYLTKALEIPLGAGFISLDASRPWMVYWTLHSLDLLQGLPCVNTLERIIDTLRRCFTLQENESSSIPTNSATAVAKSSNCNSSSPIYSMGGYGGGPQQLGHTAPTYAAVLSLCIIAGAEKCVDGPVPESVRQDAIKELTNVRSYLYTWFYSLRRTITGSGSGSRLTGFRVHHDGEVDVRGTYTVISICALLNMLTDELMENVVDYGKSVS